MKNRASREARDGTAGDGEPRPERRRRPRGPFHAIGDAFYGTLRFLEHHIRGFYGAVVAFVSVGFAVSASAILAFVAFGRVVAEGFTRSLDVAVLEAVAAYRTPTLHDVMLEITTLGNTFVVLVVTAVAAVFLWLTRHHYSVYLLVIAVLGGGILSDLLKFLYGRPRPAVIPWITETRSPSFPSGHAMTAMVAYGSIAYLVGRLEATPRLRNATYAIAAVFIVAVGASRVYLGVHYPSDVVAGYIAGVAWVAFVASTMAVIRFFEARRPELRLEELDLHAEDERRAGLRE